MITYRHMTVDELRDYDPDKNDEHIEVWGKISAFSRYGVLFSGKLHQGKPKKWIKFCGVGSERVDIAEHYYQRGEKVLIQGICQRQSRLSKDSSPYNFIWVQRTIPGQEHCLSLVDWLEGGELSLANEGQLSMYQGKEDE